MRRPFLKPGEARRFGRFLLTGLVNTGFGYAIFLIALQTMPTTFLALCVSTIIAVLFNFFTLGAWVFSAPELHRLWPFGLTYSLVFGYNAAGLAFLGNSGIRPQIGGVLLLPGAVFLSYIFNSRFVFAKNRS